MWPFSRVHKFKERSKFSLGEGAPPQITPQNLEMTGTQLEIATYLWISLSHSQIQFHIFCNIFKLQERRGIIVYCKHAPCTLILLESTEESWQYTIFNLTQTSILHIFRKCQFKFHELNNNAYTAGLVLQMVTCIPLPPTVEILELSPHLPDMGWQDSWINWYNKWN